MSVHKVKHAEPQKWRCESCDGWFEEVVSYKGIFLCKECWHGRMEVDAKLEFMKGK